MAARTSPSDPRSIRRAAHIALGAEGEARAARYLRGRGYRIVEQNVHAGGVELDLIAQKGRSVIFVEVKTRTSTHFGAGEEAVNHHKRQRLLRGAAAWLFSQPGGPFRVQFDVISWQVDRCPQDSRAQWRMRHIESAFDAGD